MSNIKPWNERRDESDIQMNTEDWMDDEITALTAALKG